MKEMIKRKDGSYSQRGLWDNIRANRGSGKKPTKEMLEQERKIRAKAEYGMQIPYMNIGGYFPRFMQEGGEPDGGMALGQMNAVIEKLMKLREFINPDSNLEPWVSSKLAVMDHYADAVHDEMMYGEIGDEEEEYEEDEEEEGEEEEEEAPMTEMELEEMKNGGIPERYRKRGFTKVGVKRKSTRPGKKWMVLAKKGDQYKIVHGGYKGMKDFTQHRNKNRQKKFWSRMGGRNSSKATDPFSPLYWHKRFGTWEDGGQLPKFQGGDTAPRGVCSVHGIPYMGGSGSSGSIVTPGTARKDVYEKEYYGGFSKDERKKLEELYKSLITEGKLNSNISAKDFIAAQGEANAVNKYFKEFSAETVFDPTNPNVVKPDLVRNVAPRVQFYRAMVPGIGKVESGRRELTAFDILNLMPVEDRKQLISRGYIQPPPQKKYGGNTNNNLNNNFMNPLYDFIQRAQMGGAQQSQDEQIMQLIAVFAQMQGVDPEQIMAQLQEMSPDEQQQALQQIMQVVQESAGDQQEQMPAMRGGGMPCFKCGGKYQGGGMMYGNTMGGPVGIPAMPVDVYGLPIYGGGGMKAYVNNPYVEDMMQMEKGGKMPYAYAYNRFEEAGNLDQMDEYGYMYGGDISKMKRGGISINPANKGKFTAKAKQAGMGVQAFASKVLSAPEGRYSPATRRQANFARNAADWKKQGGGMIEGLKVGDMLENVDEQTLRMLDQMGIQYEIV